MAANTRSFVVSALLGKVALAGFAIASPMAPTAGHDGDLGGPGASVEPVSLTHEFRIAAATPSPVPLPTSLALIGSSLLVLAVVGATL